MTDYEDDDIFPGPLRVLGFTVMSGANYFSGGPVIVMKLDLGEYDEVFTNAIPGFYETLMQRLPSLDEHFCSVGEKGGFFQRVRQGTLLGHVTEHVAIELQTLAGMDAAYGKTRSTSKPGVYHVVFRFLDEKAGIHAGKAAVNLINSTLLKKSFDVDGIVRNLVDIREKRLLGPTTQALVDEARKRKIPCLRLDPYNLVQLGTGKFQKRIRAAISSDTGFIAVETAADKRLTIQMLADAGIPVPQTVTVANAKDAVTFQERLGKPIVLKPCKGNLGNGISVGLTDVGKMLTAFGWAKSFDETVLAQEEVCGDSYRLLVIDFKFAGAVKMTPPSVSGDGIRTIRELIGELNSDPNRGVGDKSKLTKVTFDAVTEKLLADSDFHMETILPEKTVLPLKRSGNLKLGGSAVDVTEGVHEKNRFLAERASRVLGLNVAGVDVIAPTLRSPISENGGTVIEINSAPDFRPHIRPSAGSPRNVAKPFVDMIFPKGARTHSPIFSVTGSLGKTDAIRLLTHCLTQAGHSPGLASSAGLFLSNRLMKPGDMTDPENVALILKEPSVDCAVLETPIEGILRRGLGYEWADFGIILNLHDRPIQADYATTIEDIAYAKSVVAEQVRETGLSILNADMVQTPEIMARAGGQVALFSKNGENKNFRRHVERGGIAASVDGNEIIVFDGKKRVSVLKDADKTSVVRDLPDTCACDVLLSSVLALYGFGLSPDEIKNGLTRIVF